MSKSRNYRLGDLQLKIMKVLWERRAAGVAEVYQALGGDGGLAYTTVATMLRKMEARGLVQHEAEGRRFIYRAAVRPEAVTRSMAGDVLERLFEGRLADLLSHLLATREVSRAELLELERLIAERKKQS
ncbi:MAG TPA: BlaI/MecI/CopY family transcriptional regulator [Gemmataceae bacterium]|jgi:predicted transcriptional regulator|nr:BlaI/MecI/CopY family transcriptional regulator [Gemmataceae bacterium]